MTGSRKVSVAAVVVTLAGIVALAFGGSGRAVGARQATPAASPAADCPTTSDAANEALVLRWWDEVWTGGNVDALDELMADDHLHHWASGPDTTEVAAIKERVQGWRTAFPDLRIEPQEILVEGELIAARWVATGTQQGDYQGQAPTGRPVEWHGINVFRLGCGRITEIWSEMDTLELHRQLGLPSAVGTPVTATPAP